MFEQYKSAATLFGFISLLLVIAWLAYTKASIQSKYEKAQVSVALLTSANEDWAAQVAVSNKSIAEIKAQAEKREAEAKKALGAAKKEASLYAMRAVELMASKPKGDDCDATKRLILEYLGARP